MYIADFYTKILDAEFFFLGGWGGGCTNWMAM